MIVWDIVGAIVWVDNCKKLNLRGRKRAILRVSFIQFKQLS